MKQTINLGAYGWRHSHWLESFYPQDLPIEGDEDWRLSYYSNEFNAVLVPVDYWQDVKAGDCEDWLGSVCADFRFFVECHNRMFDNISLADLSEALKNLKPQLSALVFLNEHQPVSDAIKKQFTELAGLLEVEVLDAVSDAARFVLIENELLDLRTVRTMVEQFVAQTNNPGMKETVATIIVKHPQLQAVNLSRFRAVLDIMGC